MANSDDELQRISDQNDDDYKYGFFSGDVETDIIPAGLNEEVIRLISRKKGEPDWLLDFRLKAFRHWLPLPPPTWGDLDMPAIDFQPIINDAAPPKK